MLCKICRRKMDEAAMAYLEHAEHTDKELNVCTTCIGKHFDGIAPFGQIYIGDGVEIDTYTAYYLFDW